MVSIVLRFYIWFVVTVYYKMRQMLLQNATAILLQNGTEVYYKMRQVFYCKMRQLLQNATFITNCDSTNVAMILFFSFCFWNLQCKFNIWDFNFSKTSLYITASSLCKFTFHCLVLTKATLNCYFYWVFTIICLFITF